MPPSQFIGDLAKRVGMSVKAIRYYEDLGLLAAPERSEAGYRLYGAADEERLRFILGAKALGLSLADIKEVLALQGEGGTCGHVQQLLAAKIAEIDRRVAELTSFRDALAGWLVAAEAPAEAPCRHIAGAASGAFAHTPPEAVLAPAPAPRRKR